MSIGQLYATVRQLHEHPRVVALAAAPTGPLLVWVVAAVLLAPTAMVYAVCPLLALVFLAPERRTAILSLGSVWVLYGVLAGHGVTGVVPMAAGFLLIAGLLYLCFLAARAYQRLPVLVQRNAQIWLHIALWAALLSTWLLAAVDGTSRGLAQDLQALRVVLPFLVWRCGYMLLSGRRGSAAQSRFVDHLFYCLPAYGGTGVPYGKGHDHLTRHRAATPEALARTRLAGLKVLVLAWQWAAVRRLLAILVYGESATGFASILARHSLGMPRLRAMIAGSTSSSLVVLWISVLLEFVDVTLDLAIPGHLIIGCLRLFGYDVFRNTYKPLLAQSIVDFWNRFYYYFKELLLEFFFFPTYLSYFKSRPRLRIFSATMAAAFLGNVYYHALRDVDDLGRAGLAGTWALLSPRMFYAFLLGIGVCASMLREQRRRGAPPLAVPEPLRTLRAVRRIAGVWLFYSLIHIWNVHPPKLTFAERTEFFLSLFGLR